MRKPYNDKKQQLSKNQRNALKFICLINLMLGSHIRSFPSPHLAFSSPQCDKHFLVIPEKNSVHKTITVKHIPACARVFVVLR